MTMPVFTWFPDRGSQHSAKPNVNVTKFGDGYEVRVPVGINNQPMKWTLTFDRTRDEALAILAFLRQQGAVQAFQWTNPLQEQGVYVCRSWKSDQQGGSIRITCDFEQVFEY